VVVGLQDREIFLPEMLIARLATVKREEKREIRIVGVEQVQGTQIECMVAGNRREKCVQKVVFFLVKLGVVDAKDFVKIGTCPVYLCQVKIVDHDGQRKLAEVVSVQLDLLDSLAPYNAARCVLTPLQGRRRDLRVNFPLSTNSVFGKKNVSQGNENILARPRRRSGVSLAQGGC
jgi:hypothetical protein